MAGRCFDVMRTMYSRVLRSLLINGQMTEEFETEAGVPQGSVLSPFLYAIYINGLHKSLSDAGLGVWVLGRRVPLLLYADDIALLASSEVELQAMLDLVSSYARRWRFHTNHKKSNVVVMGTRAQKLRCAAFTWELAGRRLIVLEEYKYLGAESGKASRAAGRWNSLLGRLLTRAKLALSALMYQCGGSDGLRPRTAIATGRTRSGPCASMRVSYGRGRFQLRGSRNWRRFRTALVKRRWACMPTRRRWGAGGAGSRGDAI